VAFGDTLNPHEILSRLKNMWAAAPFGFDFVRPSDGINLHSFGCLLSTSTSLVGKGIKDGGKLWEGVMQENKKKWMELCERAADEQDPKKLAALILQINFVLEAKELRLKGEIPTQLTAEDDVANLDL